MKYIASEKFTDRTAGSKARDDVEKILLDKGFIRLSVDIPKSSDGFLSKVSNSYRAGIKWQQAVEQLKENDEIVIQFPLVSHTLKLRAVLKKLKRKHVKIIFVVHDLDMFRILTLKRKIRLFFEERGVFDIVDKAIVHNETMKQKMINMGISTNKLVSLEIFDYLIEKDEYPKNISYGDTLIVAGALPKHKVGYLYKGPKTPQYNLYGVGYEANFPNMDYHGSFPPSELPFVLKGSYGLIWDGDSLDTCSGTYGEYLRINNPHKTSLYLASGIPVVIWKGAALADFVLKNNVGVAVDSLVNIKEILDNISEEQYVQMKKNAIDLSKKLRSGYYTIQAIRKAED